MQRGGIDKGVLFLIVIVAVIVVAVVVVSLALRTDEVSDLVETGGQLAVLLVIELNDGRLSTQTLFYDSASDRGALFDVPSHTGVVVESLDRIDSIDTVFFTDGIDAYRQAVGTLVGVDIPFSIHLDDSGLEAVVDLLAGLSVFVTDLPNEGPNAVRIPSGDVVLDGAKAVEYVTYAGDGERARERIARHQKLVVSLLKELGENHRTFSDPRMSRVLIDQMDTNMERAALVSLMRELGALESDRLITRQVEGVDRQVDTDGAEKMLLFPHQEGRWLKESVRQVVDNLASEGSVLDENIVIRLEILNGTDETGLARRTAELYRSYGFDVVAVGNAQSGTVENTLVVDRVGNDIFARRTADIIRASLVDSDVDPQGAVDVTIILGEDFDGRYVR